jgi:hypothetical protein
VILGAILMHIIYDIFDYKSIDLWDNTVDDLDAVFLEMKRIVRRQPNARKEAERQNSRTNIAGNKHCAQSLISAQRYRATRRANIIFVFTLVVV